MSQHSSLKSSKAGKKHRTVLKRFERFFTFKEKGVLNDGSSVFGLPKLKIIRTKIKKEKAAEEKPEAVEAAAAEGGAVPAKEVAPKKEAAPKAVKEEKKK